MASNVLVKDGAGADQTYKTTQTASVHTSHHNVDALPGNVQAEVGNIKTNSDTMATVVKTEDTAHGSGDKGVMLLAVRTDTTAAKSGTDGDYEPIQVKGGRLVTGTAPDTTENLTWITSGSLAADTSFASIDCRSFKEVWLEFIMSPTTDPVGNLYIEYSMDDSTWYVFKIDSGKWSKVDAGSNLTVTESDGKVAVADPAAETRFSMGVAHPPPYMRWRWDQTTGGSATGASAKSFGRA